MKLFDWNERNTCIYLCRRCGLRFRTPKIGYPMTSCAVMHTGNECCHYGEERVVLEKSLFSFEEQR